MFCSSVDWRDTEMQRHCLMLLVSIIKVCPAVGTPTPRVCILGVSANGHLFHDGPFDLIVGHQV